MILTVCVSHKVAKILTVSQVIGTVSSPIKEKYKN